MSYSNFIDEHLRICMLRELYDQSDYALNASLLSDMIKPYGFSVSRAKIKTEFNWLEEQGLVVVRDVMGLTVGELTERGADAAQGNVIVPGVKRPGPKS